MAIRLIALAAGLIVGLAHAAGAQQSDTSIPGNRGELVTPIVPGPPTYTDPAGEPSRDTLFETKPRGTPVCDYDARAYLGDLADQVSRTAERAQLYRGWLASELIGRSAYRQGEHVGEVQDIFVGANGTISAITVERAGVLEIGDRVARVSQWSFDRASGRVEITFNDPVQRTYDEDVPTGIGQYRVSAVRGDWTRIPIEGCSIRHGELADVVFSRAGRIVAVIEHRASRLGGGTFAYHFHGYVDGWKRFIGHYNLPKKQGEATPGVAVNPARFAARPGKPADATVGSGGQR